MAEDIISLDTNEYDEAQISYDERVASLRFLTDNFNHKESARGNSRLQAYITAVTVLKSTRTNFENFQLRIVTQLGDVRSGFSAADEAGA
ncbi:MAG: hypothetical protein LBC96_02900 [Lachnospiraceae bacterium]|jgi:hypothetical protein|nr:hypothetical protein [Lachnospiraceae bacterium]